MLLLLFHRNMKRWRWRYLGVSSLLALSFVLFVLYASFMSTAQSENTLDELDLPYDALVVVGPGAKIYSHAELYNQLPWTNHLAVAVRYEALIKHMEAAVSLSVNSPIGAFSLLGLDTTVHYNPENLNLTGRFLASPGEIVLPAHLADRTGMQLGDHLEISAQTNHFWAPGMRHKSFVLVGTYDAYDLQPALISLEDALSLTGDGAANAALFTYDREVRPINIDNDDDALTWFLTWLKGVYPQANILKAHTSVEVSNAILGRIQQSGLGILFFIVLFAFIGTLTIVMMTYWERRREYASLRSVGINNRQLGSLLALEFGTTGIAGLLLGIMILVVFSSQIEWIASLGTGKLLLLCFISSGCVILALILAVLYPFLVVRIASVHQLLYARNIPLRTTFSDHMERPDIDLVSLEREHNLRVLMLYPFGEKSGEVFILKNVNDQVKQGETIAISERFFGYLTHEWRSPCDGYVASIGVNGVLAISPSDPDTPFYPYPSHFLEIDRARRERAAEGAKRKAAVEHDSIAASVADYTIVSKEEQASVRGRKKRWSRYLVLAAWLLAAVLGYVALNQALLEQRRASTYTATEVKRGTLQQVLSYTGALEPRLSMDVRLKESGCLEALLVADGERVNQGQPLLRLENASLHLALAQAQEEQIQAQLVYDTLLLRGDAAATEEELSLIVDRNQYEALQRKQEGLRITAPADGKITDILADVGAHVDSDTELFGFASSSTLKSSENKAQILQAKARMDAASAALEALEIRSEFSGTVGDDVAEKRAISAGETLLSVTRSSDDLGRDDLLDWQRGQLELEARQKEVDKLVVTAPATGILSGLSLKVGEEISASQVIGKLQKAGDVVLVIHVPQQDMTDIRLGDIATVLNYGDNRNYDARVVEIAQEGSENPQSRKVTYEVRMRVDSGNASRFTRGADIKISASSGRQLGTYKAQMVETEVIDLAPSVPGTVVEILIANGDSVEAGQVIARMANPKLELSLAEQQHEIESMLRQVIKAPQAAVLEAVHVQSGDKVSPGDLLVSLSDARQEAEYAWAAQVYQEMIAGMTTEEMIHNSTAGRITSLHVQVGDEVQTGQLLCELTNPDLEVEMTLAMTRIAKREAALLAEKANPAAGPLAVARLHLTAAEAKLVQAEEAIANLLVVAPADGTIRLSRAYKAGESLTKGQTLATVHADNDLTLTVSVDENLVHYFEEGMQVNFLLEAFGEEHFRGYVDAISHEAQLMDNAAFFTVRFTLPRDERFRSGMTASAYLLLQEVPNALIIPSEYLYLERVDGEVYEFVRIMKGGKLEIIRVETGLKVEGYVEIRSGLAEEELVYRLK